jgi:hypothetical protein
MKGKLFGAMIAAALVGSVVPTGSAEAAAYGTNFQVSITYQNVGTSPATVSFDFFQENSSSAVSFTPASTLAPGASTSLAVGSVAGIGAGFKGSAVLSADQPVVATIVQFAGGISARPLSNGFSSTDASASQLIATVLKNQFGYNSYFSVQNVEAQPVDLTVKFFPVGATTPLHTATFANLPANAAKYYDTGTITQLGSQFNGSAVVEAKLAGNTTPAKTVITVNELQINGNGAKSFEGTSKNGANVFMASAMCKFTAAQQTHAYAVQNASATDSVTFEVTYKIVGRADIIAGPYSLAPPSLARPPALTSWRCRMFAGQTTPTTTLVLASAPTSRSRTSAPALRTTFACSTSTVTASCWQRTTSARSTRALRRTRTRHRLQARLTRVVASASTAVALIVWAPATAAARSFLPTMARS